MKKVLVVVIIAVIVALLLAYKCSRSRGEENVETSTEASEAEQKPAEEAAPAQEAEPAPAAEEAAPAENKEAAEEEVKEEPAPEQKEEAAPAPAPVKKEKKEAKPDNADAEKVEKPAEKPAPKPVEEKKPVEREEKAVQERPVNSNRAPEGSNIDSAGVSKVINVSKAAIKRCYDKALTSNPMLKGKLSVKININEQGRVDSTEVVEDSLHDAEVAKCVKGVIGRLRFPKPAGGTASITFPFAFDPKNQ